MIEIFRFLSASGIGQAVLICAAFIWVFLEVRSLKARAKEDRETTQRQFRELSEGIERRSKEDREATERRAKEYSSQNEAEHARLSTSIDKVDTKVERVDAKVDDLKTNVEVLLDRLNRPDSGSGTD